MAHTATKTEETRRETSAAKHKFHTSIDVPSASREKLNALCNQQLADISDLYTQTKQAHWNVKGSDFIQLHELFDSLAAEVLEFVDLIAERVTSLGGYAMGTARMAAHNSRLPEYPTSAIGGREHVEALVARYAELAHSTRDAIEASDKLGDPTTADLFTQVSRALDKQLWFLEAHLQA